MKTWLRIALINFIIFFAIIIGIELFFKLNTYFNFITPPPPVKIRSATPWMTKETFYKKYGPNVIDIPDDVLATDTYDFETLSKIGHHESSIKEYPPDYYKSNQNQRKNRHFPSTAETSITHVPIFKTTYFFDENGNKKVFSPLNKKSLYQDAVITLGCSITFGTGVQPGYDYPSQLSKKIQTTHHLYNLAVQGDGPNNTYKDLVILNKKIDYIKEKSGIALWLFIPDHLDRFFCSTLCERNKPYIQRKPYLKLIDNQIVYTSDFQNSNLPERWLYRFLSSFETLAFFNFQLPLHYSESDIKLFTQVFGEIKKRISDTVPLKKFYLINFFNIDQKNEIYSALEQNGISIVDYSNIPLTSFYDHLTIPVDNHPTAKFHWILTEMLKKDIFQE